MVEKSWKHVRNSFVTRRYKLPVIPTPKWTVNCS